MHETTTAAVTACPVQPIGPDFDLHAPEHGPQMYEILDATREACPVTHSNTYGGYWVVTRFEDARAVALNPEVFSNCNGPTFPTFPGTATNEMIPITLDPPELTPYRKLLTPLFSPREAGRRSTVADDVSNYLIDQFIENGEADFYRDYASPLAAIVTLRFLGMDATDWHRHCELSHYITDHGTFDQLTEEQQAEIVPQFVSAMGAFFEEAAAKITEAKATSPQARSESLVDRIVDATIDGEPIPIEKLTSIFNLVFQAGLDTTAMALSVMVHRLGRDHDLQNFLRDNHDRVEDFVEESLRINSTTTFMQKTAKSDVVLGGAEIKEGDPVLISWAAANRDPREFENPNVFDIDREGKRRHTSFGVGVHRCLGSHIARQNLRIGITELLRRVSNIRIDPERAQTTATCGTIFGYRRLPATFATGRREGNYPDDVLTGRW